MFNPACGSGGAAMFSPACGSGGAAMFNPACGSAGAAIPDGDALSPCQVSATGNSSLLSEEAPLQEESITRRIAADPKCKFAMPNASPQITRDAMQSE